MLYKEKRTIYFLSVQRIPASFRLQILNFNQQHCNFTKGRWFVDFKNFGKFSCGIIQCSLFLHVFVWFAVLTLPPPLKKKMLQDNIQIQLPHQSSNLHIAPISTGECLLVKMPSKEIFLLGYCKLD